MSYIGSEETQKEAEFFGPVNGTNIPAEYDASICKSYSVSCVSGDFNKKLGYAISFKPAEHFEHLFDGCDPIYLSTARGDFRMFKTAEAAASLLMKKGISSAMFYFDPR